MSSILKLARSSQYVGGPLWYGPQANHTPSIPHTVRTRQVKPKEFLDASLLIMTDYRREDGERTCIKQPIADDSPIVGCFRWTKCTRDQRQSTQPKSESKQRRLEEYYRFEWHRLSLIKLVKRLPQPTQSICDLAPVAEPEFTSETTSRFRSRTDHRLSSLQSSLLSCFCLPSVASFPASKYYSTMALF